MRVYKKYKMSANSEDRTHADFRPVDLKSTPLTTRAYWLYSTIYASNQLKTLKISEWLKMKFVNQIFNNYIWIFKWKSSLKPSKVNNSQSKLKKLTQ